MTISISGKVFQLQNDARQPAAQVTVVAETVQASPTLKVEAKTNDKGEYLLADLKTGRWRLRAQHPGWALRDVWIENLAWFIIEPTNLNN